MYTNDILTLSENTVKTAVFCWGRFQPATKGHALVFQKSYELARDHNGSFFVFTSQTKNDDNSPIEYSQKVEFMRKLFPKISSRIIYDEKINTIFDVAQKLYQDGYQRIILVVGSDKVETFRETLTNYNGRRAKSTSLFYKFNQIDVVQAGDDRVEGEDSLRGTSGTEAREAAKEGDFDKFVSIMPKANVKIVRQVFNSIRQSYGLDVNPTESIELERDSVREEFFSGDSFKVGDKVMHDDQEAIIESLGCNFVRLKSNGVIKKAWIEDLEKR